ncbi:hypothetical protein SALBM311S_12715 [Streptomyces alboniger]
MCRGPPSSGPLQAGARNSGRAAGGVAAVPLVHLREQIACNAIDAATASPYGPRKRFPRLCRPFQPLTCGAAEGDQLEHQLMHLLFCRRTQGPGQLPHPAPTTRTTALAHPHNRGIWRQAMQSRAAIASVSLLAGAALLTLSGNTAQAVSVRGDHSRDTVPTVGADLRAASTVLYVAPSGKDSAAGTQADPTTLTSAISRIASGGTIYLRGGTCRSPRRSPSRPAATAPPAPSPPSPPTRVRSRCWTSRRRARVRPTGASS